MKIVHLMPHFSDDGNGVVYAATDLACTQSAAGHSVACIGDRTGALIRLMEDRAVTTYVIPKLKFRRHLNPIALYRLWRILKTLRPELVHAHTIPTALAAKILKPFLGYNLVTSVHNGPRLRNMLLVAAGERVICVSAAVANKLNKFPLVARKLRIVRNGPIGSPRRSDPPPRYADVSEPAILTLAGLHAHKGINDLIDAFAIAHRSVPDLSLYILGDGPERHRLQTQAERLECSSKIHFRGFISDPRAYLEKADLFVLPSHMEAFGLSIAEAREAGCAVIGMNVGGIPEVLEGGRRGFLLDAKSPSELARVIIELFSDEKLLRLWQDRASSNLSWLHVDRVYREMLSVYSELIQSARTTGSHVPLARKSIR